MGWVLVGAIVWLSLTPEPPHPVDFRLLDKLEHLTAYGALMFWFAFLYRRTRTRAAYAFGFIAMGIAIEFIQPYTGRDFELADMLADALGVALGWAALAAFRWLPRS
jgi:VanZ family protein